MQQYYLVRMVIYGLLGILHSPLKLICTLLQLAVSLARCNHAASGMFLVTSCGAY